VIIGIRPSDFEDAAITSAAGTGEEDETITGLAGGKSLWTARVSSRSAVRPGAALALAVDTSQLHYFDPTSGQATGRVAACGSDPARCTQ
jgi:multiple sugar transport system ATP-binding protein